MSIMLLRHVLHVLPGFLYIVLLWHIFVCEHVFICMHWLQNVSCMCARDCDCVFALCVCVYVCVHTCISTYVHGGNCVYLYVCVCVLWLSNNFGLLLILFYSSHFLGVTWSEYVTRLVVLATPVKPIQNGRQFS